MLNASIVIPAYNAETYLTKTLNSIAQQTLVNFECIVVDDGSTDSTANIVESYGDKRFKVIRLEHSGGPARPRNRGIEIAQHEFVFIFDADDIMAPGKLEDSVTVMQRNPGAGMLFTNFDSIDENDNKLSNGCLDNHNSFNKLLADSVNDNDVYYLQSSDVFPVILQSNFIGTSSVVLRKSRLKKTDLFDEQLKNADDYLFWVMFLRENDAIFLNRKLHSYRVGAHGISGRTYLERGASRVKVLEILCDHCEQTNYRIIARARLSKEYFLMAYAYKQKGEYKLEAKYARRSLVLSFSPKALKLLVHSIAGQAFTYIFSGQEK